MNPAELIAARKKAEEAVMEMSDGPLKVKAFEVILTSLLANSSSVNGTPQQTVREPNEPRRSSATSLAARVNVLSDEGYFSEPRSLSEIQSKLAEHGWHYDQPNLSTPLIRLVRQRVLRRLAAVVGGKKVWKYALP